ncbi:MAG TPA: DUF5678 domain-containing protein [Anaerolineae bacterium]|nr:DUF5678 domain-containing protein [Anaerolineae bacterium]
MSTVVLRDDLHETLKRNARQESRSVDEIVNEAVSLYLRERQRAKLDKEIAAYEAMHAELRQRYLGQWIAVHEQQLVDHDPDGSALYQRIRSRYGKTSVLIRQVREQPSDDAYVRTPSSGKAAL